MKNWFLSVDEAITLSLIAFLPYSGRALLDWRYESSRLGSAGSISESVLLLSFMIFSGGWVWAMLAAQRGSRSALTVCLILPLLLDVLTALATVLFWCPVSTCNGFPHLWPFTWTQLITGLLASIAIASQLRQKMAAS